MLFYAVLPKNFSKKLKFINFISNIGIRKEYSDVIKRKVSITNRLAFFLLFFALAYTTLGLIKGVPIFVIPLSTLPVIFSILLLNYFGFQKVSRVLSAIAPGLTVVLYHAAMMQEGESPTIAATTVSIVFFIIPFILFDLKEKAELFFSLGVHVFLLLSVYDLSSIIDIPMDSSYSRTRTYESVVTVVAIVMGSGMLYILLDANKVGQQKSDKLIEEIEAQKSNLMDSEKSLRQYISEIEENKKVEENRNWEIQKISESNKIIRKHQDLTKLAEEILFKVIKDLKAGQGAIYLVEKRKNHEKEAEEDTQNVLLKGISCYAYERKRFFETEILPGEGIIGQCFWEEDIIYITDIPRDYLHISSGLGESTPTMLIAVPLIANQQAIGVMEIASFHQIENYQREFLQKLAENIAVAFSSIQNKLNTEQLLRQVQELNQNYEKQQTEMAQKIEVLKKQREHYRKRAGIA